MVPGNRELVTSVADVRDGWGQPWNQRAGHEIQCHHRSRVT